MSRILEELQVQKACIQIQKASLEESSSIISGAANRLKGQLPLLSSGGNDFQFIVQFNPSQISFETQGRRKEQKVNFQKQEDEVMGQTYLYEPITPLVHMKVKLIFDRVLYADDSVQQEAEGFLAAVRNPAAQELVFQWNTFQFGGTLSTVSVQYTMFSPGGAPVRAEVELSISGKKEQAKVFEKDYRKLMGY